MHILIIPSWYKLTKDSYTGSFFDDQAKALTDLGHKVSFLYPDYSGSFKQRFISKEEFKKINVSDFTTFHQTINPLIFGDSTINLNHIKKIGLEAFDKLVENVGQLDIIHAHSMFYGGVIANEISLKRKIPFVITEHLSGIISKNDFRKKLYSKIFIQASKKADKIIFVSDFLFQKIKNTYNVVFNNNIIIPNVLSEEFEDVTLKKSYIKNEFNLVIIGRQDENKNHISLIEAIGILNRRSSLKINLLIVGDGTLNSALKNLVTKSVLNSFISFIGKTNSFGIKSLISNSHALISASYIETFGVTLIEALACGRPVVSTPSGGPFDIVNENNGVMCVGFDAKSIAKGIEDCIKKYHRFDQDLIRKKALNKYGSKVIAEQLIEIYKESM